MRYSNEQPLEITETPGSTNVKPFWSAFAIPFGNSFPPSKTYVEEVVANNYGTVDGSLDISAGTITNESVPVNPAQEILRGSCLVRTRSDRPLFSRTTTQEMTVFALDVSLNQVIGFESSAGLDIYDEASQTSALKVSFNATPVLDIRCFGHHITYQLPSDLVIPTPWIFRTRQFYLALDTKLLDLPPVPSGELASYSVELRLVYTSNQKQVQVSILKTTLQANPTIRYVFEAKQDVRA